MAKKVCIYVVAQDLVQPAATDEVKTIPIHRESDTQVQQFSLCSPLWPPSVRFIVKVVGEPVVLSRLAAFGAGL